MASEADGIAGQLIQAVNEPPVGARWAPTVGEEATALLEHIRIPLESRPRLLAEAARVVSRCIPPIDRVGSATGLVVGYVQSGKTASFTTVAALARDNGYRLVIVISGTTTNLFDQSADRLEDDLRIKERTDHAWHMIRSPLRDARAISNTLDRWRLPSPTGRRPPTVLLGVMKNRSHLDSLIKVLSTLKLADIPTLVIDDEADQAGLNTLVRRSRQSPTYSRLLQLRRCLPHHSYLQYTATPQGPLLISILDALSPDFADVLSAGPGYTGGVEFFINNNGLIETIPSDDIPSRDHSLTSPPDSLRRAMALFVIGVAAGLCERDSGPTKKGERNRSMMVHPSQSTMPHAQYAQWTQAILDAWKAIITVGPADPDYPDLLDELHHAYDDLLTTYPSIAPLDELVPHIHDALLESHVEELNTRAGATPKIEWNTRYPFILVGGEVLSRGYTVEGLTITYMPRGSGVGNADTIQQRARFFGYKQAYLGLCRVFLEPTVQNVFRAYIEHEEDIRSQLARYRDTGADLQDWKRELLLDLALKPTRANIIENPFVRGELAEDWYQVRRPLDDINVITANRSVVRSFINSLTFRPEGEPPRTPEQVHLVAHDVPLSSVYEQLLSRVRYNQPDESPQLILLLVQLRRYLEEHPNETTDVFRMSGMRIRQRSIRDEKIINLFQGRNPRTGRPIYPGDREVINRSKLTVQIHMLRLTDQTETGPVLANDVPVIAVWVPHRFGKPILIQSQPDRDGV